MHWTVAASFFWLTESPGYPWIDDFVPGDRHQFTKIPRRGQVQSWHERKSKTTQLSEWRSFWNQGQEAIRLTQGGIITVFPQLATIVGVQKCL